MHKSPDLWVLCEGFAVIFSAEQKI